MHRLVLEVVKQALMQLIGLMADRPGKPICDVVEHHEGIVDVQNHGKIEFRPFGHILK